MTEHPLHNLAMDIRKDLTAAQGKLTELMRQVGELELPNPTIRTSFMNGPVTAHHCPECGVAGNHTSDCQTLHRFIAEHGLTGSGAAQQLIDTADSTTIAKETT